LQNITADGKIHINDCADHSYLLALGMTRNAGLQRHLFLPYFAPLMSGSFLGFVVILVGWELIIDYEMNGIAAMKCVFFMSYK
jgi:hypothetical protein